MSIAGKRILICGSRNLSPSFSNALIEKGARPVQLPLFSARLLPADRLTVAVRVLLRLSRYDGLILSSANGVGFFAQMLRQHQIQLPDSLILGVVGKKTALQLSAHFPGIAATVQASNLQDLLKKISRQTRAESERWVHFTSVESLQKIRLTVPENLHLERLPIYHLVAEPLDTDLIPEKLIDETDAVLFTSPSSVDYLLDRIHGKDLLRQKQMFALGPSTAMHLKRLGLTVARTAAKPSAEEIGKMLENYFDTSLLKIVSTRG